MQVVSAVVVFKTTAIKTLPEDDPDLQEAINSGIVQDFGRLASDYISIEFLANGEPLSVHVSYATQIDSVSICIGVGVCMLGW